MFTDLLETLLEARGITSDAKEDFLNPDYAKLSDPLLLPDMGRARDRVIQAIRENEHIVVFADYDCDGIPAAVVMSDFFRLIKYDNISFYIPHRHNEGFGLNIDAINECKERGAKLIVTVDCGTSDVEEVAHAKSLGIDVVITDHHLPSSELPSAVAIVNPKLGEGHTELCGSGVAYKLVQAILSKGPPAGGFGVKLGMEKWSLDMVGIATLSDMVPLVGENRILAKFGLDVLRKSPRPGLAALLRRLSIEQRYLTEDDIAFMITPRINAASRMGSPEDAFKLLSTTSDIEAERLAAHLEQINNERKSVVAAMVKEAKKKLEARSNKLEAVIVIGNPEWRPSLAGLVANSLVEEYERPVFVWGRDGDGVLKGSCRTHNGYNLHTLMTSASENFLEFGGHAGAGGFSLSLEQVPVLEEKLSQVALTSPPAPLLHKERGVEIDINHINEDLWKTVSLLAPFGEGNEKPVFKISSEVKRVKKFGKEKNHLELELENDVRAIEFFSTREFKLQAISYKLSATLEKSYFRGRPELRLRIVDIMPA